MEDQVPYVGWAMAAWVVFSLTAGLFLRKPAAVLLVGMLLSAALVSYCMHYQGAFYAGGIPHAICGALAVVGVFEVANRARNKKQKQRMSEVDT